MKRYSLFTVICLALSGQACAQLPPKPASAMFTPVASQCNLTQCQQNCYLQKSQCDRNDDSGCSTQMQSCTQACTAQCR
ncbi:hypothetical protein [Erwinia oleae]|uniref:hypothetical protein n=1 Tax=Erwinia oleae TaxID=796334 RepID=UPI000552BED3|nr:hypothetical protein [Erwinia oleae]